MHRTYLKNILNTYHPQDVGEQASKKQMLDFLTAHPDCFERTLEIGHFTASAWLLNPDGTKALLTHHRKLGKWLQLGGHCDGDPDVLAASLKEASEESGLPSIRPLDTAIFDIDIHLIPETAKEKAHSHYDIRFLLQADSEDVKISHESKELLWIDANPQNLPTNDPSVLRMFNKWLNL